MTPASTRLDLPAAFYAFVGIGATLFALVTTNIVQRQAEAFRQDVLAEAVFVRTRAAALSMGRALDRDWTHLLSVRDNMPIGNLPSLASTLTILSGDGERVAWAGYAGLDGTVLAASEGLLVGADISARPWFQHGLQGPYAGDVHDAVLLNRLLGGMEDDPLRFLDLAAPVKGPDGQVAGVLGFHVSAAWAEGFLAETAEALDLDLYLVNQSGDVILATDGLGGASLDLPSMRSAATGIQTSGFETWPSGERFYTAVVPQIIHGTLPSFGWRLVGRIDPSAFEVQGSSLQATLIATLAMAGAVLLLLSMVFARIYLRPISRLARNANRIANGHDEYPFESRRTTEIALLSGALARLQGQQG